MGYDYEQEKRLKESHMNTKPVPMYIQWLTLIISGVLIAVTYGLIALGTVVHMVMTFVGHLLGVH